MDCTNKKKLLQIAIGRHYRVLSKSYDVCSCVIPYMIYSNEEAGTMRAKIPFDFLSEEEKRRLCRNRSPELLDKSIMFSLFKLIFVFYCESVWKREGHNWARCGKYPVIKRGFDTILATCSACSTQLKF